MNLQKSKKKERKELKIYHDTKHKKNADSKQVELFFYENSSNL